jgi:hypothetical protein
MRLGALRAMLASAMVALLALAVLMSTSPQQAVASHADHVAAGFTDVSPSVTTVPADAKVWHQTVNFANNLVGCGLFGSTAEFGAKIDTGNPGTYEIGDSGVFVTISGTAVTGYTVSVTGGVLVDLFLKHVTDTNEWYHFEPGVTFASGLQTNGQNDVSHFSACVDVAQASIEVTKTATSTWTVACTWEIQKVADQNTIILTPPDDEATIEYTVTVTPDCDEVAEVSGTVTVTNDGELDVDITDVYDDLQAGATLSCVDEANVAVTFPHTLAIGKSIDCDYEVTVTDPTNPPTTNTATAEWDVDGEAQAAVTSVAVNTNFPASPAVTDGCVTLDDTLVDLEGQVICWDDPPADFVITYTFEVTIDHCGQTIENIVTATTDDTLTESSDTAEVVVVCAGEGCSPGFFGATHGRTGAIIHFADWPAGYAPGDSFDAVFGTSTSNPTLIQALNSGGGGVDRAFRIGTAALLSAAHPDVAYAYTTAEAIKMVQDAIDAFQSGDDALGNSILDQLETWSDDEVTCPL